MRRPDFSRRVAITGLGIVSPIGNDIPTVWTNLIEGNTFRRARHTLWNCLERAGRPSSGG